MKLDIIIPLLNEYECIEELIRRLSYVNQKLLTKDIEIKVIVIDDGSDEDFKTLLDKYDKNYSFIKVITLTRNFGHQAALRAGIDSSSGDAAIMMDGDLQDPPELIFDMVEKWIGGYDYVNTVRTNGNNHSFIKNITSSMFYKIFEKSTSFESTKNSGDFRLISKWMIDEIKSVKEHNLYLRGYIDWLGGRKAIVEYERDERFGGQRKYKYSQSYKLAIDGLISFSNFFPNVFNKVLFVSTTLIVSSFFWIIYNILNRYEKLIEGWSSTVLLLMFITVTQLFGFTFITYYLKKILEQTSGRKNYQIKRPKSGLI